jgi:arylsulfatase A-like enzyme
MNTPNLDRFLQDSVVFTNAYTSLARTFPSWMSILTGKYPLHNHARSNLADPTLIEKNQTLAKELMLAGYQTIYATDEKRFSNITKQYGFNQIIGPGMGIDDFILGGLSDFPLSNLLVNTSPGRVLFPYQYSNRAAAITYEPEKFLQMLKLGLNHRTDKPLFLAVHFCITHWPFTWAQDNLALDSTLEERYANSLEAADKQLGEFMLFLSQSGLLKNSLVVILSDHGTTLGMKNDRAISKKTYQGDLQKIKLVKVYSYDKKNLDNSDLVIDTSYGQGSDVLSLHQNHVLLAIKNFGTPILSHHHVNLPVALFDLAPTVLDLLKLAPLKESDGMSLAPYLLTDKAPVPERPLFIESGHSVNEIETNDIFIEQVVKNAISLYAMNPKNGQIFIRPEAEKSIKLSKQRAVLWKNWFLAKYPESSRNTLVQDPKTKQFTLKPITNPAYIVILNTKNGEWGIGLNSPTAKKAPSEKLMNYMKEFYREENL